jgi:hypothetical protein
MILSRCYYVHFALFVALLSCLLCSFFFYAFDICLSVEKVMYAHSTARMHYKKRSFTFYTCLSFYSIGPFGIFLTAKQAIQGVTVFSDVRSSQTYFFSAYEHAGAIADIRFITCKLCVCLFLLCFCQLRVDGF